MSAKLSVGEQEGTAKTKAFLGCTLYSVKLQYPFFKIFELYLVPQSLSGKLSSCFTVNPSPMFLRFHKRCIRQWLELQRSGNTCPICRTFVTRVSLFNIFSYETVCLFARFRIRPFICWNVSTYISTYNLDSYCFVTSFWLFILCKCTFKKY